MHMKVGVSDAGNFVPWAIQWLVATIWQGLLQAINATLLLLDWTFSLDLVGRSLASIRQALAHLNEDILGEAWLLAGIAIAGLWGIWTGLVRRRTVETLGSLAATVLLICLALLIIHQPGNTVGRLSSIANDSSLQALELPVDGSIDSPASAYASATQNLFNNVVLKPWCALQFGDVGYCLERPGKICTKDEDGLISDGKIKCHDFEGTVADAWLAHSAGSEERHKLFRYLKDKDPERVRLQDSGGTVARVGLLALIGAGALGALLLMAYLAIRLVAAATETLVLLLAAPIVLIIPAFGEPGREGFLTYLKRLGGAAVAKFVYALALAVVLLISNLLAGLDGIGWYGKWLLLTAFWWGVLLKRHDLVGFVGPQRNRSGTNLASVYYGYRMARETGGVVTGLPRRAARLGTAPVRGVRNRFASRRQAREGALRQDAEQQLRRRGEAEVRGRREGEASRAARIREAAVADRGRAEGVRGELRGVEGNLARARGRRDELRARLDALGSSKGRAAGRQRRELTEGLRATEGQVSSLESRRRGLETERSGLDRRLSSPEYAWAHSARRYADDEPVRESEVRDWVRSRERALSGGPGAGDAQSAADRDLLARASGNRQGRGTRRSASRELRVDPERSRAVREWSRQLRRSERRDRRVQHRRARMGRR